MEEPAYYRVPVSEEGRGTEERMNERGKGNKLNIIRCGNLSVLHTEK